jgi:molecular chaperone GrpE
MEKEVNKEKPKEPAAASASEDKEKPSFAKATEREEELKKKLEECEKKAAEYLTCWQRERADFLNYKKEELERLGEILKYADIGLILKILPILDNFEMAEKKLTADLKNDENIKGILQIKAQIKDFLKSQGVEEIESLGKKFNPNFMEVVEEINPAFAKTSAGEAGIVIEEIQKGYKLHGKVLCPAKVKISK